ncbi:uncharacterized protein F5Z01DRAFT_189318 [Emericellopsis atlantica]|uniref:Uncharacterized protein n=1 Tax=Emericellopsis atlantica TaxID=2614577 RepID=A0A9P8CPL6_9HYPO|nr:uncharacterized protein F5Z01DRAFT_189318 [Emericellopsis atlantica]KAG9252871.1 hypothetical protein F5Z01DRAFT_189318 [Emericellopsis atlantica]
MHVAQLLQWTFVVSTRTGASRDWTRQKGSDSSGQTHAHSVLQSFVCEPSANAKLSRTWSMTCLGVSVFSWCSTGLQSQPDSAIGDE